MYGGSEVEFSNSSDLGGLLPVGSISRSGFYRAETEIYENIRRRLDIEWLNMDGGLIVRLGVYFVFFWAIIGVYIYREAKKERRSSPKLRGFGWGVFALIGVVKYLIHLPESDKSRTKWLALALACFVFWGIGTFGLQELAAWYPWAAFYAGLFILYVKFDLATFNSSRRNENTL
ncbi:hypothetical protein [Haladaptatus sp. CMAA 1911]|uniref:hypothetical protein n=1 Tax=unclassified Haladaptatus TaxID=2622732 RepID=UPI0037540EC2